ncbi:MAG: LPS export ABC transporter periplasmic protein LptC [Gemmatimonadota bacterium]|nr:LPS export ABC transporter periplasmic protein LptC [Gemmatimonadota bacterium]
MRGVRLAAVAILLAALVGCGEEDPSTGTAELPVGRPDLPTPDQVVENGVHVITYEGVKKAVVEAEQLYFYNESGKVIGDTLEVRFFDESGSYVSTLSAKSGEMIRGSEVMTARGDVFVQSSETTIRTEELRYDPAQNRIWSDEPTEIHQRGNVVRGRQGVESDPGLREIRIRGGSAVLRSEPEVESRDEPEERTGRERDGEAAGEAPAAGGEETGTGRPDGEEAGTPDQEPGAAGDAGS